ncbi:MAG: AI-2E family transporter [Solirubrobacterales bacterium]|nr:AI-2E family transporter [Solirubrobacterales bacterium]MBV9049105.1 AI-2E family transporter [Solirubrobacterales bacterium]
MIIVWQGFEDHVVQPLVYGRAVNVGPLVSIIGLLVGAELLGILGDPLAIPSAAAIEIILREWWSARDLEASARRTDEGRRADTRAGPRFRTQPQRGPRG